ncbi:hypothetical protein [Solibacillus sp. FSL K6-1523]|uniref:hypothetical protein n=1 Tax=Solibacillus sp. FSL K6-1523 TaxID=2921471 RepID=UPI0030FA8797
MKQIIVGIIIVGIFGIGIYLYYSEPTYSATDVLKRADFSVEEQAMEFLKFNYDKEELLVPIELTGKTQKELIKAFEKSKFKKNKKGGSVYLTYDYWMKITLNTGYVMYMDVINKGIAVGDNRGSYEEYLFKDDEFFSILEEKLTE